MELKEKTVFILSVNPEEEKVSSVGQFFITVSRGIIRAFVIQLTGSVQ